MSTLRNSTDDFHKLTDTDFVLVKFNLHRRALKLNKLQKFLMLSEIHTTSEMNSLSTVIFKNIGYAETLSFINKYLNFSKQTEKFTEDSIERIAIFLFEIFEDKKTRTVPMRSILLFLVILSCDDIREKFRGLFKVYSRNNLLTRLQLWKMLGDVGQIGSSLRESIGSINEAVEQCFKDCGHEVTKQHFLHWSCSEKNACMWWISTMHRLQEVSLQVQHVKCSVCKKPPTVGVLFMNSNMCMVCYLSKKEYKISINKKVLKTDDRMAKNYVNAAADENQCQLEKGEEYGVVGMRSMNNMSVKLDEWQKISVQALVGLESGQDNVTTLQKIPFMKRLQEVLETHKMMEQEIEILKLAISSSSKVVFPGESEA